MTLKELRDRRVALLTEADSIFTRAGAENRRLSAEEAARDDAITAEMGALDGDIRRAEAHAERMRSAPGLAAVQPQQGNGSAFATLGEQMVAVVRAARPNATPDPRLIWSAPMQAGPTGMSEGIDADGGFLVSQQWADELIAPIFNGGEIASRVRKIPIGAGFNGLRMNGIDETSRANGSRWGGIRSYWVPEGGLLTPSQPKFKQISLELEKLTGLCYATSELLADTTALESWLGQAFRDEFTFRIEDAIVNGTGAGMPLGIMNSGAAITVTKETSQAAATLLGPNVMKMWARMPAKLRNNAVWLVNQDIEPQLWSMMVVVKNVAGTENVGGFAAPQISYTPPGTNGNEFGMLMGRPVIPTEYSSTLGTAGDIALVDLSQYLLIEKGGVNAQTSMHVRFLYDEMAFRFIYRVNGMPLWSVAQTPYKGANTLSPFVVLQSR